MKLYRVTLRGFIGSDYRVSYVVCKNCNDAYLTVLIALANKDLGFPKERELLSVELIAEDAQYPDCETRLFLTPHKEAENESE